VVADPDVATHAIASQARSSVVVADPDVATHAIASQAKHVGPRAIDVCVKVVPRGITSDGVDATSKQVALGRAVGCSGSGGGGDVRVWEGGGGGSKHHMTQAWHGGSRGNTCLHKLGRQDGWIV
jgi:hypothetical protein